MRTTDIEAVVRAELAVAERKNGIFKILEATYVLDVLYITCEIAGAGLITAERECLVYGYTLKVVRHQSANIPVLSVHRTKPKQKKKRGVIYCVTNRINGKQYVGKTRGSLANRWYHHKNAAVNSKRISILGQAIMEFGAAAFKVKVLERPVLRYLDVREAFWIHELNTVYPNGYNKNR